MNERSWIVGVWSLAAAMTACYGASSGDHEGGAGSGGTTASGGSQAGGSTASGGKLGTGGAASGGTSTGGSAGGGGISSAGSGGVDCSADAFATVDKYCTTSADCVLVDRQTSCCGDRLRMAISSSAEANFTPLAMYCAAQYPLCDCLAEGVSAEDGVVSGFDDDKIEAVCTESVCHSVYTGTRFGCATASCSAAQYCTIYSGGAAGSEPTGSCQPLFGCTDCACLGYGSGGGCLCSETDGQITITCAAP